MADYPTHQPLQAVNLAATETHNLKTPLSRRWLRGLAWASVISAFALIILGGVVRVTGSGLGCGGDWPLCDGRLLPALTAADIIEYSHRLVASAIVGPLIIATAAVAWLRFRRERWLSISAAVAVVLLLLQGGLGGVTVLTELPGHIVAAHLALAQALLGCLLLILIAAYRRPLFPPGHPHSAHPELVEGSGGRPLSPPGQPYPAHPEPVAGAGGRSLSPPGQPHSAHPELVEGSGGRSFSPPGHPVSAHPELVEGWAARFPRWAMLSALATYLLILSGAFVTATPGALAACPDWPLCQGWTLPVDHLPAVNMFHRIVAALLGLLIIYTLHLGWRRGGRKSGGGNIIRILSLAGLILFAAQLLVGGIAVWTGFPVELRALHIALATAVWAVMASLALLSSRVMAAAAT